MRREPAQTVRRIKRGVVRMKHMAGGVIDVQQDRVEAFVRHARINTAGIHPCIEITGEKFTARIRTQSGSQRDQSPSMPVDHHRQRLDNQ